MYALEFGEHDLLHELTILMTLTSLTDFTDYAQDDWNMIIFILTFHVLSTCVGVRRRGTTL